MLKAVRQVLVAVLALLTLIESVAWAGVVADGSGHAANTGLVLVGPLLGMAAGSILHVAAHELGHLLAAKMLRLPVLGVRIWNLELGAPGTRLPGSKGHVRVDLARAPHALPARMVAFFAAGPLADLAAASVAFAVAAQPAAPFTCRVVGVGMAAAGLLATVLNLVPHTPSGGRANDGLALLRWLTRPRRELARSRRPRPELSTLRPIAPPE